MKKKFKNHIYGEFVTIQEKFKFLGNSPILLFNDKFLQFDRTFFLILKNGRLFSNFGAKLAFSNEKQYFKFKAVL